MRVTKWCVFALALILSARYSSVASAQSSHLEEFSSDMDAPGDNLNPVTRNPIGLELGAPFVGVPPVDWNDLRTGWTGLIEEKDDPPFGAAYPPVDPGASTPQYGVIQHEGGTGPYWSPTGFDNDCLTLCYNVDLWADPVIAPNSNGIPDFWWTNAVADAGGSYITESGITATANLGGTWSWATTGGIPIATVPVGSWYELEVCFTQGADGDLDAVHNVWDATHTVLYGSVPLTSLFLSPANQPMTPAYSWFTFFEANIDVIFADQFQVECAVPEPSSMILAGMGAVGMVVVARRRRRA